MYFVHVKKTAKKKLQAKGVDQKQRNNYYINMGIRACARR